MMSLLLKNVEEQNPIFCDEQLVREMSRKQKSVPIRGTLGYT